MSRAIPHNWNNSLLSDVCFFQEGPGLRNWQYRNEGVKFINIRCIQRGDIDISVAQHLAAEEVQEKYEHFLLNEGDYVLSSSGTIGRLAVVKKHHLPLLLNTSVIRFRSINEKKLDNKFLRHFLQSKQFFDKISEQSQGSAQVNFGPTHLKLLEVMLPPISEQKKIASILTSVDEVIENTQKQIEKLQDLKKATMNELLTKGIGHTEFKDSELGKIPKIWEVVSLLDYSSANKYSFVNGPFGSDLLSSELTDSGVPVIYVQDIKDGNYSNKSGRYVTNQKADALPACNVNTGDVIIQKVGDPPCGAAVYKSEGRAIVTQDVIRIKVNRENHAGFLTQLLNSKMGVNQVKKISIEGTRTRVSLTEFKKLKFPKPSLNEQNEIYFAVNSIQKKIELTNQKLSQAQSLKKSLMQDLLTGRVRV